MGPQPAALDASLSYVGDLCIASLDGHGLDLLSLARRHPERYPFLMESSAGSAAQSRYDVLMACPGLDNEDTLETGPALAPADFFDALDSAQRAARITPIQALPFVGGWFVYLSYEMAGAVEPSLSLPASRDGLPLALAVRCRAAVIRDRATGAVTIIAENRSEDTIQRIRADIAACREHASRDALGNAIDDTPLLSRWTEPPGQRYREMVVAAREYILAGDVFQANLCRAWQGELLESVSPARVYAALRRANPAPFSGLMQWRGRALACSSPERLLRIDHAGMASVRPIAGTRARLALQDRASTDALLAHPKERAEHVMLIDLVRNDLGRVCMPGSITVDELMITESYAHVHHIVSNVQGRLMPGTGAGSALRAVFPGGTITGCPKVRCMQIIAELEDDGRGAYTGSFGYVSRCGRMDSNIIIRSLTQHGRSLTLRAGAGIVADSVPEQELAETQAKARGVLRAFVDDRGRPHG